MAIILWFGRGNGLIALLGGGKTVTINVSTLRLRVHAKSSDVFLCLEEDR